MPCSAQLILRGHARGRPLTVAILLVAICKLLPALSESAPAAACEGAGAEEAECNSESAHGPVFLQLSQTSEVSTVEATGRHLKPAESSPSHLPSKEHSIKHQKLLTELGQWQNKALGRAWQAFAAGGMRKDVAQEHMAFIQPKHAPWTVEVDIASTSQLAIIYLAIWVPMMMAWAKYWLTGNDANWKEWFRVLLLCLMLATSNLTLILANQSLCVLMKAPQTLAVFQGGAMFASFCLVSLWQSWRSWEQQEGTQPGLSVAKRAMLWLPASCSFGIMQVADHYVSDNASISSRVVFGNLAPVVGMAGEAMMAAVLVPRDSDKASTSLTSKIALSCVVCGSVLFATQYPDFTQIGVTWCVLQTTARVIFRMNQRYWIDKVQDVPTTQLVCLDGLLAGLLAFLPSLGEVDGFLGPWNAWLSDPSVLVMLMLSTASYCMMQTCGILLLRQSTATSVMVVSNIGTGMSIIFGLYCFGDRDFERPFAFVGMVVCLAGGLCHSIHVGGAFGKGSEPPEVMAQETIHIKS